MTKVSKINNTNFKESCIKCGKHNISNPVFHLGQDDWFCNDCKTNQLQAIKLMGFRYYAYLLSGSWTSKYFFARNVQEGYRLAKKEYKGKKEVLRSYMVGPADGYCLSNWLSF